MSEPPEAQERLEQLFERTLRGIADGRAPLTLQARVLDELRRRAQRPWWQRSFAHWPRLARGTFLLLSAGLIDLLWIASRGGAAYLHSLHESGALKLSWPRALAAVVDAAGDLLGALAHLIPTAWLYGAAVLAVALYALLFGLGTVAYRTLFLER